MFEVLTFQYKILILNFIYLYISSFPYYIIFSVTFLIHTLLLSSTSVFATINLYQINHKALLIANEVNRFICSVIRAHLRDLRTKKEKI